MWAAPISDRLDESHFISFSTFIHRKCVFSLLWESKNQGYCSDTILWFWDHCSHTPLLFLPASYLPPHTPDFAGGGYHQSVLCRYFSFWIFLQIWPEQNKRLDTLGERLRLNSVCVCVWLIQQWNLEAALTTPSLELLDFLKLLIFWWPAVVGGQSYSQ